MSKNISEFKIIEQFFKPLTKGCKESLELLDDVAEISLLKNQKLVISKDLMVENVHFLFSEGGFKIASKLLRSNLSDIASAGAKPCYYMLGFSKNSKIDEKFIKEFSLGLKSVQDKFKVRLIGGDTVSSEQLVFSITIFGVIENNKRLTRNKAKEKDLIYVSGSIGDAYLGLNINSNPNKKISKKDKQYLQNRHFFPTPRIKLGKELAKSNLSKCAIDVSDGLLADLKHICEASKLMAEIEIDKIPLSKAAKKILQDYSNQESYNDKFLDLITGGDDYELIFTINEKHQTKIADLSKKLKLDLTYIGKLSKSDKCEIKVFDKTNKEIKIKKYGYEH
jgi:thiamine-monophosphate kinase